MQCPRCSRVNEDGATFCAGCGSSFSATGPSSRRLARRPAEGRIAGVCAGIAAYVDLDPTLVRLLWIILSVVPGAVIGGVIAYIAAWALMPESVEVSEHPASSRRLLRSFDDRKIAGVCGGLAEYFEIDATVIRIAAVILAIYPGAVIGGVLTYVVAWLVIPPAPPTQFEAAPV